MGTSAVKADDEIVALYFERDESAIEHTDRKYGKYLSDFADRILCNRQDSEECRNDVYLALWNSIPPQRPVNLKAYLTRIARNLAIDRYRRKTTGKETVDVYALSLDELYECFRSSGNVEKEVEDRELAAFINRFVASLDKEKRLIFVSRYYLCRPIREIAARIGKSETTVFNQLSSIRERLSEQLRKEGFYHA